MMVTEMTNNKNRSLADQTYDILKKKIIKQDLKPGEYLDEKGLMQELNIGRTPLRQAILLLKNENLIEGKPNKTPYVKELTLDEMKELYETLAILEKNIAFLAALRINRRDLNNLIAIQKDHDRAIKKVQGNIDRESWETISWDIIDLNFKFHRCLSMATENRFLQRAYRSIRIQSERFSVINFLHNRMEDRSRNELWATLSKHHHDMIECLENRDPKKIADIAVDHVQCFQNQIISSMLNIYCA